MQFFFQKLNLHGLLIKKLPIKVTHGDKIISPTKKLERKIKSYKIFTPEASWVKLNVRFGHSHAENCNNCCRFKHGLHHQEDNIKSAIATAG
jgi:hypothetical protein